MKLKLDTCRQETKFKTGVRWQQIIWLGAMLFLFVNCSARLGVLFTSCSPAIMWMGIAGIALCLFPIYKPAYLKAVLLCFVLTFPLYGSFPYSRNTFLFELYLSFLSLTLFVKINLDGISSQKNVVLQRLLLLYVTLSCFSLLLLPFRNIAWQLLLWNWDTFWNAVFFATPELYLYSVGGLTRLVLFIFFAIFLSNCREARELFRVVFLGLFIAIIWSSTVGIIDYYKLISLVSFREVFENGLRLQSVFTNPGWFAEFLIVTTPFVIFGFLESKLNTAKIISIAAVLIIFQVAIFLTYSRTGWILYPFNILSVGLLFFVISKVKGNQFTWKKTGKVFVLVATSCFVILSIGCVVIFNVVDLNKKTGNNESTQFEKRISQIANPSVRKVIWEGSLKFVKEKPVFGWGYESFKFQNSIFKKIKEQWDAPHNLYLQLLISGGAVGLVLWGIIVMLTLYLLVADMIRNKTYCNSAVILSIVAFHLYGFTQSLQYIPMIWLLIFINIGYAMTVNENVLPDWIVKKQAQVFSVLLFVVMTGIAVYANDFESRKHAKEINPEIYSLDQDQNKYLGFYPAEKWEENKIYRWSGSSAIIKLPRAQLFELTFVCSAPDLDRQPVVVSVHKGIKEIDKLYFFQQQSITKRYYIPEASSVDRKLYVHVSRTWNLKKLKVANDSRNLGVAISEVKVLEDMPPDGVGFYPWETWQGSPLPGTSDEQFSFRWTGREAAFNSQQLMSDKYLYFRAGQPGLHRNPLVVKIEQNNKEMDSFQLEDNEWKRISLKSVRDSSQPIIIKASKIWNPKIIGAGEDHRALGVAVAGLTKESLSVGAKRE